MCAEWSSQSTTSREGARSQRHHTLLSRVAAARAFRESQSILASIPVPRIWEDSSSQQTQSQNTQVRHYRSSHNTLSTVTREENEVNIQYRVPFVCIEQHQEVNADQYNRWKAEYGIGITIRTPEGSLISPDYYRLLRERHGFEVKIH